MKDGKTFSHVGAVIGRFQVPDLTRGHRNLLDAIFERHKKVLVLLGVTPLKLSRNNPLDYMTRELMIKRAYPLAVVLPLKDHPNDNEWSKSVDEIINSAVNIDSVTLYGSRDSFIPSYHGSYKAEELPASYQISGTEARNAASKEIRAEKAFRAGVTYASHNRFSISYQCVDVFIWRERQEGNQALLGRKKTDEAGKWRFIGGFVDPSDESLEMAAKREAIEETSLSVQEAKYLFSQRVEDWRYRKEMDKIMTAVFSLKYFFGKEDPKDDIDELRWFDIEELKKGDFLVVEHKEIWNKIKLNHL